MEVLEPVKMINHPSLSSQQSKQKQDLLQPCEAVLLIVHQKTCQMNYVGQRKNGEKDLLFSDHSHQVGKCKVKRIYFVSMDTTSSKMLTLSISLSEAFLNSLQATLIKCLHSKNSHYFTANIIPTSNPQRRIAGTVGGQISFFVE